MKQFQASTGCLWPIGCGFAGTIVGLIIGRLAEYLDDSQTIDLPGMLMGPSMFAGGLIGVAIGYIALLLSRLQRDGERTPR